MIVFKTSFFIQSMRLREKRRLIREKIKKEKKWSKRWGKEKMRFYWRRDKNLRQGFEL